MRPYTERHFRLLRLLAVAFGVLGLSGSSSAGAGPPRASPTSDLVEVTVHDVIPMGGDGHVVMLVSADGETVLPLAVDEYAAVAIAFRLAHVSPPRPLPADVLDSLMDELGGKVMAVTIDEPGGDGQECRVDIRQGPDSHVVMTRPADGISLALTNGTKIHATRRLLSSSGIRRSDLGEHGEPNPKSHSPSARNAKPRGRYKL